MPALFGPIRVALLDTPISAPGLVRTLETEPGIEVVGSTFDPDALWVLLAETTPDVLLVATGLDAALSLLTAVHGEFPATQIIAIAETCSDATKAAVAAAGVCAFLSRRHTGERELLKAVRTAVGAARAGVTSTQVCSHRSPASRRPCGLLTICGADHPVIARILPTARSISAGEELAPVERQIAALVGNGASNADIAAHLHLGEGTVANHLTLIYGKLGHRSGDKRAKLSTWARAQPAE